MGKHPATCHTHKKGELFGVFEFLDFLSNNNTPDSKLLGTAWDVTAGSRSVFIQWSMQDKDFLKIRWARRWARRRNQTFLAAGMNNIFTIVMASN